MNTKNLLWKLGHCGVDRIIISEILKANPNLKDIRNKKSLKTVNFALNIQR